jgi:hypothetical protein
MHKEYYGISGTGFGCVAYWNPPMVRIDSRWCAAIEIARGHFERLSKCALKSLNNQTDFDSAIRRFDPSRPSQHSSC